MLADGGDDEDEHDVRMFMMRMVVSDDKHLQEVLPLAWLHVDLALLDLVECFLLSFFCLFVCQPGECC